MAMQVLDGDRPPILGGRDGVKGLRVLPQESTHIKHNVSAESDTLSWFVYELIAIQVLRGDGPPILGEGIELERRVLNHAREISPY